MSKNAENQTMTAGEAVVDGLIRNGIDTLFCLPGIQNDLFFDTPHAHTDEIRPIHTRHEQAVAYMALGAAQATGKPSAFCVVPGPGFLNAATALALRSWHYWVKLISRPLIRATACCTRCATR